MPAAGRTTSTTAGRDGAGVGLWNCRSVLLLLPSPAGLVLRRRALWRNKRSLHTEAIKDYSYPTHWMYFAAASLGRCKRCTTCRHELMHHQSVAAMQTEVFLITNACSTPGIRLCKALSKSTATLTWPTLGGGSHAQVQCTSRRHGLLEEEVPMLNGTE